MSENKLGRCLFGRGIVNVSNGNPRNESYAGTSAGVNDANDGDGMCVRSVTDLDARDAVEMRNNGWTVSVKFVGKLALRARCALIGVFLARWGGKDSERVRM